MSHKVDRSPPLPLPWGPPPPPLWISGWAPPSPLWGCRVWAVQHMAAYKASRRALLSPDSRTI